MDKKPKKIAVIGAVDTGAIALAAQIASTKLIEEGMEMIPFDPTEAEPYAITAQPIMEYPEMFQRPDYIQPIVKGKKIGRNEACPCKSGKKYKKCCIV